MSATFAILAALAVVSATGAMVLRNPVHCALSLTVTFAALAGLYLHLDAQFVGLVQVLVYIGAVAVLIVFAILLTRSSEVSSERSRFSAGSALGAMIAVALFVILAAAINESVVRHAVPAEATDAGVRAIGERLLAEFVLPLEVIGLLLTAALIGAVLIGLEERPEAPNTSTDEQGSR